MYTYLFFGAPGSAKGTQRKFLEEYFKEKGDSVLVVETGALLRELVSSNDTAIKKELIGVMESGGLVPSVFPAYLWANELIKQKNMPDQLLVDGAGRKAVEGRLVTEFLSFIPENKLRVIFLEVPLEEVIKRLLLRGRVDDSEDVIRYRYELFMDEETGTMGSIKFLKSKEDVEFISVDGVGSREEVRDRMIKQIEMLQ